MPIKADVVNVVVPPNVTLKILKELKELKEIPIIWLQPGAESEEVIRFAKENNLPLIHNKCIMVETGDGGVENSKL